MRARELILGAVYTIKGKAFYYLCYGKTEAFICTAGYDRYGQDRGDTRFDPEQEVTLTRTYKGLVKWYILPLSVSTVEVNRYELRMFAHDRTCIGVVTVPRYYMLQYKKGVYKRPS